MGDMGELFNDLKEERRTHRQARATQAASMIEEVRAAVDSLIVDPNGTWNIVKNGEKVQFYPTKGTWQYRGKMMHGGVFQFTNWLAKI